MMVMIIITRVRVALERPGETHRGQHEDDDKPCPLHDSRSSQISSTRTSVPFPKGGSLSARTSRALATASVKRSADPFQFKGVTVGNSLRALLPPCAADQMTGW